MAYSAAIKNKYWKLRSEGYSQARAARELGIAINTANNWEKTRRHNFDEEAGGNTWRLLADERRLPLPLAANRLKPEAARALEDFGYWRYRYLGRRSTPWQEEAAYQVVEWLRSPTTELVVVNAPPGSGKSTTFTHDIPTWMICRDRSIRVLLGSRTFRLASQYALRIKRTLERTRPLPANPAQGRTEPAAGCLAADYGRFKPDTGDVWRQHEFSVLNLHDDISLIEDKEPTVSSYGMDSEFLGARANLVIWDDLVVGSILRNVESIDNQRKWWSEEGECLPPWAEMDMADGSIRRADQLQPGDEVAGIDGPTRVVAVGDNGQELVYRLQTRASRVLYVTGNHPIYTPAGWIRAEDSQGYGVKLATAQPTEKFDPDDAAILGYFVGDGGTSRDRSGSPRAIFTNADPGVLTRFTQLCEAKGWTVREGKSKSRAHHLSISGGVRRFIDEHDIGCRAENKRVPQSVMAGGPEAWKAFIAAYFDCDGTVSNRSTAPQVQFASTSLGLLRDVQMLLARMGFPARIGVPNRKNGVYRSCWPMTIQTGEAVQAFADWPVADTLKRSRLEAHRRPARFLPTITDWIETVEPIGVMPTLAIETEDHTLCTGGVVTHNTRVEPGGCLILQGQRMGAEDLYRYALDQQIIMEDEESEEEITLGSRYRHVIFPAHFEDLCTGDHRTDSPAYPSGCLLDPIRLPWKGANGLSTIRLNRTDKYRVQYQQEDVDPSSVLVPKIWVDGGRDRDGIDYPGCWDKHRGLCELPKGLSPPWYSLATADPSPTKYWSIQHWLYHPASEQRFLMDLVRQAMTAPEFLDWNENTKQFYGLMHDWQERSVDLHIPITHWIIEQNAAQRFLLQYDHVKRWQRDHKVNLIAHNTTKNKLDPDYGIQMIRDRFRFGNVRLPGKQDFHGGNGARIASMKLVDEVTRYTFDGSKGTDDCLMAYWFLEHNLVNLSKPRDKKPPRLPRPSWMRAA